MNCKPGDLAVIVKSCAGNDGKIVRCIRLLGKKEWVSPNMAVSEEWTWEVDRLLTGCFGGTSNECEDSILRPIRGDESPEQSIEAMRDLMQTKTKKEKETT